MEVFRGATLSSMRMEGARGGTEGVGDNHDAVTTSERL